jgi:5-methyltetrahydrofolate--homocysteine methyltransferase
VGYSLIKSRLHVGRPLVLDADVGAALRARDFELDGPGALGAILHRSPAAVLSHHRAELNSRVDILSALTADTTPRALAEAGMEHRSARLTAAALDLVSEAVADWERPIGLAGVLGSELVSATLRGRFEDETQEHALRIAVGGAELVIVRGMGSRIDLVFALAAAAQNDIPCWGVVETSLCPLEDTTDLALSLADAGAEAILFEVDSVDEGLRRLDALDRASTNIVPGTLLAAAPDALRGFPSPLFSSWVDRVVELTEAGARVVGGGAGTTEDHTRALAARLGILHPSLAPVAERTQAR